MIVNSSYHRRIYAYSLLNLIIIMKHLNYFSVKEVYIKDNQNIAHGQFYSIKWVDNF
jgi:hypothetical protein